MNTAAQQDTALTDKIRAAGIVGEGGAGFPAHVKYSAHVDTIIANGCECEPLLYSDQHIMAGEANGIVRAMKGVMGACRAKKGIIAIKKKYTRVADIFRTEIAGTDIELALLDNFYPAGDEQILIHEVTGKTVPPLGLPLDRGIVVANVGTLASVARALDNIPLTHKIVTVTGEVATPSVIRVPVGTPISECIAFCGGPVVPDPVVVLGGPMMGRFLDDPADVDTQVVTKTTGGIIILPRHHPLHKAARLTPEVMQKRAATACIQCRMCSELCPRYLVGQGFETHRVMRAFAGLGDRADSAGQAMMCCECGVCELFACPMGLSPRRINAFLKNRFRQENATYEGPKEVHPHQSQFRTFRRVPTPRLAARTGLEKYMSLTPEFKGDLVPNQVSIPLHQHIGAPSVALVGPGDRVALGDCIAEIPEGALGARIHASMTGTVTEVAQSITIQGN